jgi:hypothetical protein
VKTKNCVAINILGSYDFGRSLSSFILNEERNDNQLCPEEILLNIARTRRNGCNSDLQT